jgi:hypothetical protein
MKNKGTSVLQGMDFTSIVITRHRFVVENHRESDANISVDFISAVPGSQSKIVTMRCTNKQPGREQTDNRHYHNPSTYLAPWSL